MHRLAVANVAVAFSLVASIAQAQQIKLTPHVALGALDHAAADPAFEAREWADWLPVAAAAR